MERSIAADLERSYHVAVRSSSPVSGGWLNLKWKISTDAGCLLVKQFSTKRFSRQKLELVEDALQRQIKLKETGVPCPSIRTCGGRAIRLLDGDTAYMVMEFCPGAPEGAATVNERQLYNLGGAYGRMRKAFSALPTAAEDAPADGGRLLDGLWKNYRARVQESPREPAAYRNAILAQEPILRQLTKDFFDGLPQGFAHEDFAADNILFDGEQVSAILDFDRSRYGYVWHDIGRALLSFAWNGAHMEPDKIEAFRAGCSRYVPLSQTNIADALRLTWCIEAPWWIQPEFFQSNREKTARFRDELLWLTAHWFELDSLLTERVE